MALVSCDVAKDLPVPKICTASRTEVLPAPFNPVNTDSPSDKSRETSDKFRKLRIDNCVSKALSAALYNRIGITTYNASASASPPDSPSSISAELAESDSDIRTEEPVSTPITSSK